MSCALNTQDERLQCQAENSDSEQQTEQVKRHFSGSAFTYKESAQLQYKVGSQLLEMVKTAKNTNNTFSYCVDLGCGPGLLTPELAKECETVIALDLSMSMLQSNVQTHHKIQANAQSLPLLNQTVDVIYSSLMIQWCDFNQVIAQMHQALKPGGKAFIATLVKGSLFELEQAWQQVDNDTHIHDYLTHKQITNMLNTIPWSMANTEQVAQTFWFKNAKSLALELKSLGANYVKGRQHKGLMTKSSWQKMEQTYRDNFYDQQHQAVPATYQVLYIELTK